MSLDDLTPQRRLSTAEHIAHEVRTAITAGRLPAGTQLGEADLAARFEVSRGPVREALQRLVSEGLAQARLHRGVFVAEPTLDDIADVYATRTVIERGAVELLIARGQREATHRALAPHVEAMRRAARRGELAAVSDADLAFHEALVECAASPRLARAMRTLLAETRLALRELESTYTDATTQVREHETLNEAILDEPVDHVSTILAEHMDDAVRRLRDRRADAEG